MLDAVFDASSFSRCVESMLDVAALVASGRASLRRRRSRSDAETEDSIGIAAPDGEGEDSIGIAASLADVAISAATPRGDGGDGNDASVSEEERAEGDAAFVFQFDLATWRAMGGVDDENADADGSDDDTRPPLMPVDGDPYEALLDDDPDRARLALARLRLSDMDRTICAGIAYIYREAFLSEAFFKVWASDVLVTFHHFSVAAPGGPARELASRAAKRVARHWLELNPEMPPGCGSEDVLFFNEGCHALREMGVPHERLREQLLSNIARFTSHEYYRVDVSRPETYARTRVAARARASPISPSSPSRSSGRISSKPPASRTNSSETPRTTCAARASARWTCARNYTPRTFAPRPISRRTPISSPTRYSPRRRGVDFASAARIGDASGSSSSRTSRTRGAT